MKQSYIVLAAVAALAVSANAAVPVLSKRADRSDYTLTSPAEAARQTSSLLKATDASAMGVKSAAAAVSRGGVDKNAPRKAPEGTWTSIGTGTYCEDLLTIFSDVTEGQQWKVDVEQSTTEPGWYRILPYASETNPVASLLGQADTETYLYINATNPQKVYTEDFIPYGSFYFSNAVPESDWDGLEMYGTMADNVISFPSQSFMYYHTTTSQWIPTTLNGGLKLYLPGAEVKDFNFKMTSPFCAEGNKVSVDLICGSDVAEVKVVILDGEYSCSDNNAAVVAAQGTSFPGNMTLQVTLEEHGMVTLLAVALDSEGNIVGKGERYFFGVFDNDDEWTTIGTAEFTEGIYSASYSDINPETVTVTVQRHNTKGDYFRLVEPYGTNTQISSNSKFTHSDHKHCIYIDATRPDYVVVEGGPVGVNIYGEGAIYSLGARYVGTQVEDQAKEYGFFGTYDAATRTITIPDDTIMLGETSYNNGEFITGNEGTKVVFNETTAIDKIAGESSNAPAEYFNLQGQRVANPTNGLYIKRQGGKVEKSFLK